MTGPAGTGAAPAHPRPARRATGLDALRALLVAWIIGGHAVLGYSAVGGWAWDEVQESTLRPGVELVLAGLIGPSALFLMGTFFLIAGLFTPGSATRKGTGLFARDRLLRLGTPFLLCALVIWPMCVWVAYRSAGESVSYRFLLTGRDRFIDSGGLWFVAVLLIFTLCYLAWHHWGPQPREQAPTVLTVPKMLLLALGVAVATFLVRLVFPARGHQVFDLHVWQWPQLAAMFGLGVVGARHRLVEAVPARLAKASGWVTVTCLVGGPIVALLMGVDNVEADSTRFLGGWSSEALVLATFEGVLVVFGSLFLLDLAQRKLAPTRPVWEKLRRSSFAAFILQGPVLILLAVMMRPFPLPAEAKALILLGSGLFACFSLGWLLVTRTRVGRVL